MWNKWRNDLFLNYPKQFKNDFILQIESSNFARAKIVSLVLLLASICMYLVSVYVNDIYFIKQINLSLLLVSIINVILFTLQTKKMKVSILYHRIIVYFEILIIVSWCSTLLAFVPTRYELFATYSIVIFIISSLFFLKWQILLLILFGSIIYIVPICLRYLSYPVIPKLIILISIPVAAWVIARSLYLKEIQGFVAENLLIQQKNSFKQEVIRQTKLLTIYEERTVTEMVNAFIKLLEIHEPYTNGHSLKVAYLTEKIAIEMRLPLKDIKTAYWAGMMHDIGKLMIPTEILNKESKLEDNEFDLIKHHPVWGYEALSSVKSLNQIAIYILHHHEKWDGSGYPNGLAQDEIPNISQILSVADVWDAMTADRSYRKALSTDNALKEIELGRGTQFSPIVVDVFVKMVHQGL